MGRLRIMNGKGDTAVTWELDAEEAIKEAERIFKEHRARGASAFEIGSDKEATKVTEFNKNAEEIVIVPRVAGGMG